jgi:hypothetical protein
MASLEFTGDELEILNDALSYMINDFTYYEDPSEVALWEKIRAVLNV